MNNKPKLACFELWGGNSSANHAVELPGLSGWVHSTPIEPERGGGDVHYLSVCSKGRLSRVAVADVAGHGPQASRVAQNLRSIFQHHTGNWDQSALMQELNEAFAQQSSQNQFATAIVMGFYVETGELLFSTAGHPPPLWYRRQEQSWEILQDSTPHAVEIEGLPLGLIPGTSYSQTGVRLAAGDTLLLYADGITEAKNPDGRQLGRKGLMELVRTVTPGSPADTCNNILSAVQAFRDGQPRNDDETVLVLQHVN